MFPLNTINRVKLVFEMVATDLMAKLHYGTQYSNIQE